MMKLMINATNMSVMYTQSIASTTSSFSTLDIFNNIDFAEASTITQLYQHHTQLLEEKRNVAKEVDEEYRSGIMDPCREVAQQEKQAVIKKKIIQKKNYNML